MRYTLPILPLAFCLFLTSCDPNNKGQKEDDSLISISLDYPKAEVKTANMACQCFTPLAEHSVFMQDWAAEHYDGLLEEGNAMGDLTAKLRQMEQTYFELLEEARACYEDSLISFGDFYMRGAPAFPFLMQEQCKEVFYVLMLDGGMANQALYGQESIDDMPSGVESYSAE